MNAHVNRLVKGLFYPCCVCTDTQDGSRVILQKVFTILNLTVEPVSQAEHVSAQGKQTWPGSSLVM